MQSRTPLPSIVSVLALSVLAGLSGCATEGGTAEGGQAWSGALTSRWTPPAFATRPVDGERAAVLDACVATANSLGYAVARMDGAAGRVSAARRAAAAFDGAKEETLEATVTSFAPGAVQVALILREAEERSGGAVAGGLVRDRAPYDAFFARLEETLRPEAAAR